MSVPPQEAEWSFGWRSALVVSVTGILALGGCSTTPYDPDHNGAYTHPDDSYAKSPTNPLPSEQDRIDGMDDHCKRIAFDVIQAAVDGIEQDDKWDNADIYNATRQRVYQNDDADTKEDLNGPDIILTIEPANNDQVSAVISEDVYVTRDGRKTLVRRSASATVHLAHPEQLPRRAKMWNIAKKYSGAYWLFNLNATDRELNSQVYRYPKYKPDGSVDGDHAAPLSTSGTFADDNGEAYNDCNAVATVLDRLVNGSPADAANGGAPSGSK